MSQEKKKKVHKEIPEQQEVLKNTKKNMLVSASAGSGKTYVMIEYVTNLVCDKKIPVKRLLVLTFTKAAATEMKERLLKKLKSKGDDAFVLEQIDALSTANICTIDAFCERMLKKYANLVGLSSNFEIMDEGFVQKVGLDAFENAVKKFQRERETDWQELIANFKNDKSKIKEILLEIDTLLQSLADKEAFLECNAKNSEEFFENACAYIFENAKEELKNAITECEKLHAFDFEIELKKQLAPAMQSGDLIELNGVLKEYKSPRRPNCESVGQEVFDKLEVVKEMVSQVQKELKELNLEDKEGFLSQKEAKFEKILLDLFEIYKEELKTIKNSLNGLSFGDLEDYMEKLSKQQDLFGEFAYVFVDEYQDTNKIQEKIVKNIAKNCNFIAVGDAKQGIYGFRNASAEIFLKDMEDFSKDENSTVKFLKSNFRSSQKVLGFVNDIFKVCMTKESSGIDYLNGSMLDGQSEFVDDGEKAVKIDLVVPEEEEKEELPYLYSVEGASVRIKHKHERMLKEIKRRIIEVMNSQISDNEELRDCKYSDIAILSRNRDDLFEELELYLQENEIPVVSNSRSKLLDEIEIQVLLNWLKLALSVDDEVALLSVLVSPLGGSSFEVVAEERVESKESLCDIVKNDENKKFEIFNKNLKEFRENAIIFGIKGAFLKLFEKTNYRAYINLHNERVKLNLFVDKFLSQISASGFDRDLAGLVNYFENVDVVVSSEASMGEDGVLLTTIHNSKGLEYPIVFLIGCDKDILKEPFKKGYVEINERFGIALKNYDQENNSEVLTVKMQAIRKQEKSKRLVEELMIFYVALTRAKNRLCLFGDYKESYFEKITINSCRTYFDFVFLAMPQMAFSLKENGSFETPDLEVLKIEDVEENIVEKAKIYEKIEKEPKITKKIKEYLDFEYDLSETENYLLKESVTSLSHKNKEDAFEKISNEVISFVSAGVEIGNAYHLALKVLDFQNVHDANSLEIELEKNKEILQGQVELIDKDLLLENIMILKKFVVDGRVVKEKEFIMKDTLSNLIDVNNLNDKIIVQGVVDLFVVKKDEIVLIDYKYSNSNNEAYLLQNYKDQIRLYKNALENFFNLPVKEAYLLSLKNCKLIKVF